LLVSGVAIGLLLAVATAKLSAEFFMELAPLIRLLLPSPRGADRCRTCCHVVTSETRYAVDPVQALHAE